ncbi:hypothetical protein CPLU01_14213 [Colletotrichum plurivorum]|uniref:Uncharacterized protein n=1 Tax=Colletotrichum plurivorum TaxID=2175906 RepID=A0A8H6JLE2_9PEZI|nr:hypothetical protein CPLU01_14213 [Colletotrichum plurivorum]
MTEHTVLPRSSDFSERHDFWNNLFKFDSPECPDSLLLVWPIFGPLSGIAVIHSTAAAGKAFGNRQPFVAENPDGSKTFHPVASLPATYPLVSRITTSSGILDKFREVSGRMTEVHDMNWHHIYEAEAAGVTKFYCRDEECKRSNPAEGHQVWFTGIWRMDVVRQGVSEPDGYMPWNPITGRGCPEKEEWEERLEVARKRRAELRAEGDGGHVPGMIKVD